MRKAEQTILLGIADRNRVGIDCISTSRTCRRRDAQTLINSGHVIERQCQRVDGMGRRLIPARFAPGYGLTELGRAWVDSMAGPCRQVG